MIEKGQVWWYGPYEQDSITVLFVADGVVAFRYNSATNDVAATEIDAFLADYTLEREPAPYQLPAEIRRTHLGIGYKVLKEVTRQNEKWGSNRHHNDITGERSYYKLLMEAAQKLTDHHAEAGTLSWSDIMNEEIMEAYAAESDEDRVTELIQVAAVAQSWIEDIRSRA